MRRVIFILLLFPALSFAQKENTNNPSVQYSQLSSDWISFHAQDGLLFYIKKADCNRPQDGIYQEMALIKIVNTTDVPLKVDWDVMHWFDGQLWTRLPLRAENHYSIVVEGGESVEGTCDKSLPTYSALTVFCRFLNYEDKPELTRFDMVNLIISLHE